MPDALPEFVTVADAVPLLGVSERTVRRYAGQVPDSDRQAPDKGPKRYRLSTLRKLAGADQVPDMMPDTWQAAPDSAGQGQAPGITADLLRRAEVAEARAQLLESERDSLRDALKREQETAALALSQLDQARREYGVMIAATAAGRISPRVASDAPETGDNGVSPLSEPPRAPDAAAHAPTSGATGPGDPAGGRGRDSAGTEKPETGTSEQVRTDASMKRHWWEVWKVDR